MKNITCAVINADSILAASQDSRDLWEEVRRGQFQVVTLLLESLQSVEFKKLIMNTHFCNHWGVLVIDEAHLTDEWGADFRQLYKDTWSLHSCRLEHLTVVVLSASIEPGWQYQNIIKHLGFCEGAFHLSR